MRRHEIQKLYLEIQSRIGELQGAAPENVKKKLSTIGVELLKAKRQWIGTFDEVNSDDIPL